MSLVSCESDTNINKHLNYLPGAVILGLHYRRQLQQIHVTVTVQGPKMLTTDHADISYSMQCVCV